MPTNTHTINGRECFSSDWPNTTYCNGRFKHPELYKLIREINEHPMKDCISVPWVFSYHYRPMREHMNINDARAHACRKILQVLNSI
jgi:hypothetical protein